MVLSRRKKIWIAPGPLSLAAAGLLACGSAQAGERGWCVDNCATIPPGAIPAPPGTFLKAWATAHITRAQADTFVIYRHEWCMDGKALGPYGMYHLEQISKHLPTAPFQVVIQPGPHREMNEQRRLLVVQQLLERGIPDAATRVIIAFPEAEGMYGSEAARIYLRSISGVGGAGGVGGYGTGGLGTGGGMAPFGGPGGSLGIGSRGGF